MEEGFGKPWATSRQFSAGGSTLVVFPRGRRAHARFLVKNRQVAIRATYIVTIRYMSFGHKLLLAVTSYCVPIVLLFIAGIRGDLIFVVCAAAGFAFFGYFLSLVGFAGYYGLWSKSYAHVSPERVRLEQLDPVVANKVDQLPHFKHQTIRLIIAHIASVYIVWLVIFAAALLLVSNGMTQDQGVLLYGILSISALVWFAIAWSMRAMTRRRQSERPESTD